MTVSNKLKRALSGFVYIALIILSLEVGAFHLLMVSLSALCVWEFLNFTRSKLFTNLSLSLILVLAIIEICFSEDKFLYKLICFVFYGLFLLVVSLFSKIDHLEKMRQLSNVFFSWVYILIPFLMAIELYLNLGKNFLLGIFVCIWSNDTFAYLIGERWGKTKIASKVSLNKTLEGFLAGALSCVLLGILFYRLEGKAHWIALGILIPIIASIGDLIESMLKRAYKVKDSGKGLPGHGGFLDRSDSFIFVIPFIFIMYIINIIV